MLNFLYLLAAEQSKIRSSGLPKADADANDVTAILNFIFALAGAIALLVIVVSGLRYTLAGGDAQRVKKAKDGIVYAMIGLLLVIISRGIVEFVVDRL